MKLIADNTIPYLKGIIEDIAEVTYLSSGQFTAGMVKDADALIVRSVDKCSREILEGSKVKLITTATIGFDHIDTAYCKEAGIVWKNTPGSNAESVAEYLAACLFSLSMKTGEPLESKTIGIIGVGNVGRKVERICRVLGMKILRNDPPRAAQEGEAGFVSLKTIAEEADIITVHTPLTHGSYPTCHLLNEEFFSSLCKSPWLINAARGGIHDTGALLAARRSGKIGRLVLDCWENEPGICLELLKAADIATPHIAGFSADGKANATRMSLEHIRDFFGIAIDKLNEIKPPSPSHPFINLNMFKDNRIGQAILSVFNPITADRMLRQSPGNFEQFRSNYLYPHEFATYSIRGSNEEEAGILRQLGFNVCSFV